MTNKKIITITLLVTIIHFTLTSIIGHYIAVQIGTQVGHVVAGGLIESYESSEESEEEANRIFQNMKKNSENIIEKWKVPMILISLPIGPIIRPVFSKVSEVWIFKLQHPKEIDTEEELRIYKEKRKKRALVLGNVEIGINSLAFGLLVYITLKLIINRRLKNKKIVKENEQ